MAVEALRALRESQAEERATAGERWQNSGLVFTTRFGTALDAANVRKMFKRVCKMAMIGEDWTPRELWTSFVSLLSHRRRHRGDRPLGRTRLLPGWQLAASRMQ